MRKIRKVADGAAQKLSFSSSMRAVLASSVLSATLVFLTLGLTLGAGTASATPFPSAWLPRAGDGYLIPPTWAERGLRYGTPELVGLLERAARAVAEEVPGATLYVADLSLKSGAFTQWHRSHRNGCDADLFFFAVDDGGAPRPVPSRMVPFDAGGVAWMPDRDGDRVRLHFDTPRNWALVRALLTDEDTRVAMIFISEPLRDRLLRYADSIDEEPEIVRRAEAALLQPSDSEAHDDHMHVRIEAPGGVVPVSAEVYARVVVKPGAQAHRSRPHALVRHTKKKGHKPKRSRKTA
jgi:murein endopeptidase